MQKRIGIPGWKVGENSFGATVNYLEFISKYGDPVILMPNDGFIPVHAIVLPGGADLNPVSYKQSPSFTTTNIDVHKQHFYDTKLAMYINQNIPVFGICLGMQQLCAYFDSAITQDFPWHEQSKDRWCEAHEVKVTDLSPIKLQKPLFKVNSHHHQGVLLKDLHASLLPVVVAQNEASPADLKKDHLYGDNIVEAFMHTELKIAGVQWHPEELYDIYSDELFKLILR